MPPGWYPDPYSDASLRWWDGTQWTAHAAPAPVVPQGDPLTDLLTERRRGARARIAVVLVSGCAIASLFLTALTYHAEFRRTTDSVDRGASTPAMTAASLIEDGLALANLLLLLFLMAWLHRAAVLARKSGLPARRSPGWAWGAWFVPVVNFWFPYQLARDCLDWRDGDGRRLVARWWTAYVVEIALLIGTAIAAAIGTGAGLVVAGFGTVACVLAALYGRMMITAVGQSHERLVESLPVH